MIVVDSSALAHAFGAHGRLARAARTEMSGVLTVAPHHVDIETLSAWRRQVRRGELSLDAADEAREALTRAAIRRVPHEPLLERIWELRENVTTSDAAYVAIAEKLDAPLLTSDARLARASGPRCEFRLIS